MSAHTPGPWVAAESVVTPEFWSIEYVDSKGARIGDIGYLSLNPERLEANARLIASAPELLTALQAAMKFIDAHVADPDLTREMVDAYAELQAANPHAVIAKATAA